MIVCYMSKKRTRQKRIELTMYVYTYICTLGWTLKYGNEIVLFILSLIEMDAIKKIYFNDLENVSKV